MSREKYEKLRELGDQWWRGLSAPKTVMALIDDAIAEFTKERGDKNE